MDIRRSIASILVCVAAGLLASCIDGREEIWLNADGSGRADVSYSLPAAAAKFQGGEAGVRRLIEGLLKNTQGISATTSEVTTVDDRLQIRVRTDFASALKLQQVATGGNLAKLPSSATGLTGDFDVKLRGLTVDFRRTIQAGNALPGATFMPSATFKDRRLTYIIHLPRAATQSNATRVEDSGRTLVWEVPLAVAIQRPVITQFSAPIPPPRWALVTGCALGGLVVVFGVRKFLRAKASVA